MPSICHIWYYTTLRLVNSEGHGTFSGTRSLRSTVYGITQTATAPPGFKSSLGSSSRSVRAFGAQLFKDMVRYKSALRAPGTDIRHSPHTLWSE